jgi:hypothetical protein
MDVICRFPGVIAFGVSLPLNQILQGAAVPEASVIAYSFDFVFFHTFYKFQRWPCEAQAMLCHFMIG